LLEGIASQWKGVRSVHWNLTDEIASETTLAMIRNVKIVKMVKGEILRFTQDDSLLFVILRTVRTKNLRSFAPLVGAQDDMLR
jgi:hypothetical protein